MSLPSKNSHAIRLIKRLRARTHLRIKETRRYDIHTSKLAPFPSKRLSKVCYKGLAPVIDWLISWHVDDVGTHAGGDDEVAETLTLENLTGVFGREDNAVDYMVVSRTRDVRTDHLPFTDICFLYSSRVCSRIGLEIAMPIRYFLVPLNSYVLDSMENAHLHLQHKHRSCQNHQEQPLGHLESAVSRILRETFVLAAARGSIQRKVPTVDLVSRCLDAMLL